MSTGDFTQSVMDRRPLTVTEQALKALSGVPDRLEVKVDGDVGRCPNCTRLLGSVVGRLLQTGEIIMFHRNKFRCRSCNADLIWLPKHY